MTYKSLSFTRLESILARLGEATPKWVKNGLALTRELYSRFLFKQVVKMTDILDSFNLDIDEMASFTGYSVTAFEILLMNICRNLESCI